MRIDIENNISELRKRFKEARENWERDAKQIVDAWLEKVELRAKQLAPVDTGFLRENIQSLGAKVAGDTIEGSVLSAAEYSAFVELGTSKMEAQPFLQPAYEELIQELIDELAQLFENYFEEDE